MYVSVKAQFQQSKASLIWRSEGFFTNNSFEKLVLLQHILVIWNGRFCLHVMSIKIKSLSKHFRVVYVKIPPKSRNNGSLYAHVDLGRYDGNDQHLKWTVRKSSCLTTFAIPQAATFQLVGNDNQVG